MQKIIKYFSEEDFLIPHVRRTEQESIPIVQTTRCTCYLKLFVLAKHSTCFGQSFRPSSGAENCVYSKQLLLPAASSRYQQLTYTFAVYTVFELLMMDGKTVRNM